MESQGMQQSYADMWRFDRTSGSDVRYGYLYSSSKTVSDIQPRTKSEASWESGKNNDIPGTVPVSYTHLINKVFIIAAPKNIFKDRDSKYDIRIVLFYPRDTFFIFVNASLWQFWWGVFPSWGETCRPLYAQGDVYKRQMFKERCMTVSLHR